MTERPTAYMEYRSTAFELARLVDVYWDDLTQGDIGETSVAVAALDQAVDRYRDAAVAWGAIERQAET